MTLTPAQHTLAAIEEVIWWHNQFSWRKPLTLADILSEDARDHVVVVRWDCMRRVRARGRSLSQIGAIFNRDHSTVLYAVSPKRMARKRLTQIDYVQRQLLTKALSGEVRA